MTPSQVCDRPPILKQSRAKLWIRTGIFVIFATLFSLALQKDIHVGVFRWFWGVIIFLSALVVGYWLRRWVPMQVHLAARCITFSFDRIYFALIFMLVIMKAIASRVPGLHFWADVVMCVILGLMIGRLSGICLRVRDLKRQHDF